MAFVAGTRNFFITTTAVLALNADRLHYHYSFSGLCKRYLCAKFQEDRSMQADETLC